MRRVRIERRVGKVREDRASILPLDPRDQAVLRAKQRARMTRDRS